MIIDICIVVLIAIAVLIGYKKGFIKLVTKFVGFILAIVLAYFLCGSVGTYIHENLGLGNNIEQAVTNTVESYLNKDKEKEDKNELEDNKDKTTENTREENVNISTVEEKNIITKFINQAINDETIKEKNEETKDTIIKKAAEKIARYVTKGIAFASIFLITIICVYILSFILDSVFSLPVLKSFNKTGGIIFSILLLLIRISILFAIVSFAEPLKLGFVEKFIAYINSSFIAKLLYNYNLLTYIISKFI